ncbi:MAG: GNAT family N-acetyltransferase [Thermoleophilia bacterium]
MVPAIMPLDAISEDARTAVQAIYEDGFPARQRVPFAELVEGSRSGAELALVGLEDRRPMGLAFLTRLDCAGHLFLEYFAVARELRGAGRGGSLWKAVRDELAASEPGRPIVLEVEDPAEPGIDAAEAEHRARRVRFWEKAGAIALPVDGYVIPDVGGDGTEPMRLLWVPGRPADEAPRDERLLELILALYEAGYGLDRDDALVRRALRIWG